MRFKTTEELQGALQKYGNGYTHYCDNLIKATTKNRGQTLTEEQYAIWFTAFELVYTHNVDCHQFYKVLEREHGKSAAQRREKYKFVILC